MNPVYYDVAFHLQSNGFGILGDDLFGGEWGKSDKQILVIDGTGTPSPLKDTYEQPSVQILVRGSKLESDYQVYRSAKLIYDFMVSLPETVELNGTCYKGMEIGSNLAPLGKDENQRFIYSMNFITWRSA